jgi:hypothetical protein
MGVFRRRTAAGRRGFGILTVHPIQVLRLSSQSREFNHRGVGPGLAPRGRELGGGGMSFVVPPTSDPCPRIVIFRAREQRRRQSLGRFMKRPPKGTIPVRSCAAGSPKAPGRDRVAATGR